MIRRRQLFRASFFGLLFLLGCAGAQSGNPAAEDAIALPNPLRLTVTDELGIEALERDYGAFQAALAAALGVAVELVPVEDQVSGVLLLKDGKVDLALVGPSEYVVIHARTNAIPVIGITRPDYRSVLAVRSDSPIRSVADLRGKTLALSDVGSTSGHLGPVQMLVAAGLDPQTEVTVEMLGDEGSVEALTAGKAAAWGGSLTDYRAMAGDDPEAFRIVQEGEPLPSDLLVANSQLPGAVVTAIQTKILAQETALTTAIAEQENKYRGSTLKTPQDSDYDGIRTAYRTIGQGAFIDAEN
ncbi:MAG: PhnD/SsuA/transferrin family substrate-binding protein [Cyanobacteria bacterium]|nr:PhnD/SsuA/transferrin family substrate-binding protein [Cyanobacteriota bacterium]